MPGTRSARALLPPPSTSQRPGRGWAQATETQVSSGEGADVEVEGSRGAPAVGSAERTGLLVSVQLETEGRGAPLLPSTPGPESGRKGERACELCLFST